MTPCRTPLCPGEGRLPPDSGPVRSEVNVLGSFVLLALLYRARHGPNAPLGIWVAAWARTPYGGVAFEAATLLREVEEEADLAA